MTKSKRHNTFYLIAAICSGLTLVGVGILIGIQFTQKVEQKPIFDTPASQPFQNGLNSTTDPYLKNEVKNTLTKNAPELQICYKEYLTTSPQTDEGKVNIDWHIDAAGKTINPQVISTTLEDANFRACLLSKIAAIQFPIPHSGKLTYVAHVFSFKNDKKGTAGH